MTDIRKTFWVLFDEAASARAHFHTWWTLQNLASSEFKHTMNNHEIVDFFHVAFAGNYNLIFISLAKFFDRDDRSVGISKFRKELRREGHDELATSIESALHPIASDVRKILNIRNRSIGHNEEISKQRVYELNGITPNEIRSVIDAVCDVMNDVAAHLGIGNSISEGARLEKATLSMLAQLRNGEVSNVSATD